MSCCIAVTTMLLIVSYSRVVILVYCLTPPATGMQAV